jgi:hypothetical protein
MQNLILAVALIAQAAQQPAAPAVEVTTQEAMQHRTSKLLFLRVAREQRTGGSFSNIKVAVTVDARGAVVSANALRGQSARGDYGPAIYAEAESLVHALHYTPFERDGHPVAVKFSEYVSLLPPELTPETHVPFPEIKDRASIKITLRRTSCFGACPAYRVEVNGDGTVVFQWEGGRDTEVHRGAISEKSFFVLLHMFEMADFYSLRDSYRLGVTDLPTCFTSIEIDGHRKQVEDYAGRQVGMPLAVSELEDTIDQLSGAAFWVKSRTGQRTRE